MDWVSRSPFLTEALVLLCSYLRTTSSGNRKASWPGGTVTLTIG